MAIETVSRGVSKSRLTDKQVVFCEEYLIHHNATQAAIKAGYSSKTAQVQGSALLSNPMVKKYLGKRQQELMEEYSDRLFEVIQQIYYCATRDGTDFVDKDGMLITDLRKLPKRATASIDGIEQDVETWTDLTGETHQRVKTKLKLVSKAPIFRLAMEHKGLIAPKQVESTNRVIIDVSDLYGKPDDVDEIEQQILEVQARKLE